MNLSQNIVLKENYTFLVTDADGNIPGGERGLYSHDTRFLHRFEWQFASRSGDSVFQTLVAHSPQPDRAAFHYALIEGPSQIIGIHRQVRLTEGLLRDSLMVENTDMIRRVIDISLDIGSDFMDLFEARGFYREQRSLPNLAVEKGILTLCYNDGEDKYETLIEWSCNSTSPEVSFTSQQSGDGQTAHLRWQMQLEPGEIQELVITGRLNHPSLIKNHTPTLPSYEDWKRGFPESITHGPVNQDQAVLNQAIQDLRALMLVSPEGSIPAAGIPWFVAAFGRDSLLTATMLLPHHPWVSRGVLEYLGHYQGQEVNEFRGEEPGKIMHEIRLGELARKGKVPHSPYYGTIDATPLYIILLEELWEHTRDDELLRIFQPNWEACLDWMLNYGDQDQDGFLEYISAAPGKGLVVQSWKDSDDSMSHSDGTLAAGYIRPAEVQGYAYRAFSAAAKFYQTLGNPEKAAEFKTHAEKLKQNFDTVFWNDSICCYAMALDGEHRPLLVKNSNAGQLLWTGIVPKERAAALVSTLMGDELYSGWGIRTLGTKEVRYNPVSYHNGSVWPHDTALIAMGLWKYRFISEAEQLVRDLFDLAGSQGDRRLPELIAGYPRSSSPPVPYPVACRPQAWDAAALVYLHPLLMRD